MHGREHLVAVMPIDKGMMMNVIRYENELRSSGKFFRDLKDVKYDKGLVGLASELIARNSAPFDPSKFKDTYAVELSELVKKKARGQKITIPAAPAKEPSNVVNLMDALKKSLGKEKPAKPAKPSPASKRKSAR
jgi:DNA end-binding protein Ku